MSLITREPYVPSKNGHDNMSNAKKTDSAGICRQMWVALFRAGFTVAEIAEEFGLSRQSIYNSINRLLIDKMVLEHKIALAHRQHGPDPEEGGE